MKILLVKFPQIYFQGLSRMLQQRNANVRCKLVSSIQDALTELNFLHYDLTIVDLSGMDAGYQESLAKIRLKATGGPLVVVAEEDSASLLESLKLLGVSAFVSKSETPETLLRVINLALVKFRQTTPAVPTDDPVSQPFVTNLTDSIGHGSRQNVLTPRQLQVLEVLAQGKPNKLIARDLDVSENTVKAHLKAVFRILGARNRTEAVSYATRLRLIVQ